MTSSWFYWENNLRGGPLSNGKSGEGNLTPRKEADFAVRSALPAEEMDPAPIALQTGWVLALSGLKGEGPCERRFAE